MESEKTKVTCKLCGNVFEVDKPDMESSFGRVLAGVYELIVQNATCDDCINREEIEFQNYQNKLMVEQKIEELPFANTFDVELAPDNGKLARLIATNYQYKKNHLYIADTYNTGKTRSVCHVLGKLMERGLKCNYMTCNDFLDEYSQRSAEMGKVRAGNWISSLLHCEVLVLDDLGKKRISMSACEGLYNLLDYRYTERGGCRALIYFTANLSGKDIIRKFEDVSTGEAFRSRLKRMNFVATALEAD